MNIGANKNVMMGHNVGTYFVQTQPSPTEGAHAQELTRKEFLTAAQASPHVQIDFDEITHGLYLRFDQPRIEVV
jgi:hypothetical protein